MAVICVRASARTTSFRSLSSTLVSFILTFYALKRSDWPNHVIRLVKRFDWTTCCCSGWGFSSYMRGDMGKKGLVPYAVINAGEFF